MATVIWSQNALRASPLTRAGVLLLLVLGAGADVSADPLTEGSQVERAKPGRKFTVPEHDLFPESIAHDPVSGDYFLGSMSRGHRDFAYPTTGVLVGDTLVLVASSYADRPRRDGAVAQHGDVYIHELPLIEEGGS